MTFFGLDPLLLPHHPRSSGLINITVVVVTMVMAIVIVMVVTVARAMVIIMATVVDGANNSGCWGNAGVQAPNIHCDSELSRKHGDLVACRGYVD